MNSTQLNFAHLCDMAFLSREGKLNVIGIFESIHAKQFPVKVPKMSLVINVKLDTGKHHFKIRMLKENSQDEIVKIEGDIDAKNTGNVGFINEIINTNFPEEGNYNVEIWIDDEPIKKLEFNISQVK